MKRKLCTYFALVCLDLLSAEEFPPESLELFHSVLTGLSVGTHNAGTQFI